MSEYPLTDAGNMQTDIANEYRVSFIVEVTPEEGDTEQGIIGYVEDLAGEWLPDGFVFTVEAVK